MSSESAATPDRKGIKGIDSSEKELQNKHDRKDRAGTLGFVNLGPSAFSSLSMSVFATF